MTTVCSTCGIPASLKCARCKQSHYCGVEHQKINWPEHKKTCRATPAPKPATSPFHMFSPATDPTSWARGLSKKKAAEWFVDSFRLRMDDDQTYADGDGHNLYFASRMEKMQEFLIFCKLAVAQKVVPQDLDWTLVLKEAADCVGYGFEKSDAVEKYGQAVSLRIVAEVIYKVNVMELGYNGHHESYHACAKTVRAKKLFQNPDLFVDVGGLEPWLTFRQNFHPPKPMY